MKFIIRGYNEGWDATTEILKLRSKGEEMGGVAGVAGVAEVAEVAGVADCDGVVLPSMSRWKNDRTMLLNVRSTDHHRLFLDKVEELQLN